MPESITLEQAQQVGDLFCLDWTVIPLKWWHKGLLVELEHGKKERVIIPKCSKNKPVPSDSNVTNDDILKTAQIALAHIAEYPDYYQRLNRMEKSAEKYWEKQGTKPSVFLKSGSKGGGIAKPKKMQNK
jgi:hypothetical protein